MNLRSFMVINNRFDASLLAITILSFIYILIYRSEAPTFGFLEFPFITQLFVKNESGSALEAIAASILAGYVVYVFIELLPRFSELRGNIQILNNLAASIKIAFDDFNPFSWERPISFLEDRNVSSDEGLEKIKKEIFESKNNHFKLKLSMETAHSQKLAFSQALVVAVKVSPECGLRWMDVTSAAARLGELYETYSGLPKIADEDTYAVSQQTDGNPREGIHSEMADRFFQYIEVVFYWKKCLPEI